jgi:hypothetical protein
MSKLAFLTMFVAAALVTPFRLGVSLRSVAPKEADEVARIQAHILAAEQVAGHRDLSKLTPSARQARLRLLRELRAYRERGVFPQNRDFPGRRVPYFIDADGVRCAMAHLIEISGGTELVRHVTRTRNNAYVRELMDEPGFVAWLDRNGLTVEEAARIQPEYDDYAYSRPGLDSGARRMLAVASLSASAVGILANVQRGSTRASCGVRGFTGVGLGLASAIAGGALIFDPDSNAWGLCSVFLGGTSLFMGSSQLAHAPPPRITATAWRSADGTPGLALRMAF